eukprot:7230024-Lingulodinium_polyedra.AAC.1
MVLRGAWPGPRTLDGRLVDGLVHLVQLSQRVLKQGLNALRQVVLEERAAVLAEGPEGLPVKDPLQPRATLGAAGNADARDPQIHRCTSRHSRPRRQTAHRLCPM